MAQALELPCIDLSSPDRISTAESIRQACLDYGFFYLVNHGIEDEMLKQVFDESRKFFSMPLQKKMRLARRDLKESFYIGPMEGGNLNQWPSEGVLPHWRATMESYHEKILAVGKRLLSLIALALNLDESFFEQVGAPMGWVRLLHYPGELAVSDTGTYGASAHSDYGMITLLATDGVQGLQICREKDKVPRVWEDVPHANGAFIVNIGDMLERWTNCLFRSTLHRVIATGQERYSVAFFLDPNSDCMVECLESCCSEACPPKFPPIRSGDYLQERLRLTYALKG
ncbi:2-oxoglutarate-Fe(II) type oxidoreductase hxnY isoform X4 [Magnolia sinica]|uniref:2-oxoglutarate-Fe(II) type oxidoreductase hxnY isoform X4 n=1 Tax=Magnolia sinica TaxID=86752 RepID=UPI00265804E0|nr:2-oxoglutarate-Fe(II) type oxidoreductase hxnY isoform X4 [Magnolia sinica]